MDRQQWADKWKAHPTVSSSSTYSPRPQGSSSKPPKGKKSKVNFQASENNTNDEATMTIPPCSCGAERRFEFQLMPSLLHVLEVDKHATSNHQTDDLDVIMSADYGGMNWGSIAVYTCTQPDCGCSEDYLVVQASVDETPCKRAVADAPVFIDEGQTFDPLTSDGVALEGCNDDGEEDEDTVADESDLVFTLDG
jgi:Programmed cell death protein 2, C-terminal putative domain